MNNYKNSSFFRKRWNSTFVFDKVLPMWQRHLIKFAIWLIDPYWYLLLVIARLKHKKNIKKYRTSICAIFKDESLSIKEWIEFHKLIGIDHIYLYNNNTTDSSLDIIKPYENSGFVTLTDWILPPPCQSQAYQHFREHFWEETNWVAFIDLDEYICPKRALDINDWLNDFEGYPCVTMYWRMFGSSGLIEHDNSRLITEQYTIAWDKYNDIGKPFFNTRFEAAPASLKNIHELPGLLRLFGCKFKIPPINEFKYFSRFKCNRIGLFHSIEDFSLQLNHYATKSYLEYFISRRKRGDVNAFKNNTSIRSYVYSQEFAIKADYSIFRYIPFLKVRISNGEITNYFDEE